MVDQTTFLLTAMSRGCWRRRRAFCCGVLIAALLPSLTVSPAVIANEASSATGPDREIDFVRDIRPLFRQHCYDCHGADEQESGFRLDIRSEAFKGGYGYGKVLVPGDTEQSLLLKMVAGHEDYPQMPPGDPLPAEAVSLLQRWVEQGSDWPRDADDSLLEDLTDHWAFEPLASPNDQETSLPAAVAIDHFVQQKLEQAGLEFSPLADRRTWLRRVSFDLIGLPPTPRELDRFVADTSPKAFERVVDCLLQSPRYGERWAQHWLDVVRYADTHGFEVNTPRPNAWPYRDYVIDAFNQDLPYDQFIREQLAGDQFESDAATGFLVTAAALLPGQIGKDEPSKRLARQDELAEMIINCSEAFLGLSVGCARCHDHKTDPISHRDYYSLQAFFSGVRYGERPIQSPANDQRLAEAQAAKQTIRQVDQRLSELSQAANSAANEIRLKPRRGRFLRFTVHHANRHPSLGVIEPCIDEFEVFAPGEEKHNIALADFGTRVTASGSRTSERHRLEFINDGKYGNDRSWMSDENGRGWVMFEFPEPVEVERVVWSRDRKGEFSDRTATAFSLHIGSDADDLQLVAGLSESQSRDLQQLISEKQRLNRSLTEMGQPKKVFAGRFETPASTFVLLRGDPEQPHAEVTPAVPAVFRQSSDASPDTMELTADASDAERRRALAEWIADPQNPLTARVMVNRIWQGHFGTGLVATSSDFGRAGAKPTHPRLLDWLATEFIRSGWSVKHIHRLIVLSKTYRQSSRIDPAAEEIDVDTRLLWRYPPRRLEAEAIRDAMLFVSGNLNTAMGGPGFDFFTRRGGLSGFPPIESFEADGLKRMIYSHKVRMERNPVFGAFDCPDAGQTAARRQQSTTPIQALNLFNSQFTFDQSKVLAERVRRAAGGDIDAQIRKLFRLTLGRLPRGEEVKEIRPLVSEHGVELLARVIFNSNEFLFIP
jgi:hypothetical protein